MAEERIEARQIPLLYRVLHASYARGTAMSQFINRRVSATGWVACGVLLITAVLGVDVLNSSLYQVFALVLALLAVSLLWAWSRRARLSATRELPRYATAQGLRRRPTGRSTRSRCWWPSVRSDPRSPMAMVRNARVPRAGSKKSTLW